jgi:hypothetical protein
MDSSLGLVESEGATHPPEPSVPRISFHLFCEPQHRTDVLYGCVVFLQTVLFLTHADLASKPTSKRSSVRCSSCSAPLSDPVLVNLHLLLVHLLLFVFVFPTLFPFSNVSTMYAS